MSQDPLDIILSSIPASALAEPYRTKKGAIKFQPESDWSLDRLPEIESEFQQTTGRPLPVRVRGQGAIHNKWNYEHEGSADIGLSPSSKEGQVLMAQLRRRNVPFLAFDQAIPGVATGPHIHVGRPSKRKGASKPVNPGGDELDALLQNVPPGDIPGSGTTATGQSDDLDKLLEGIPSQQSIAGRRTRQPRRDRPLTPASPFQRVSPEQQEALRSAVERIEQRKARIQVPDVKEILSGATADVTQPTTFDEDRRLRSAQLEQEKRAKAELRKRIAAENYNTRDEEYKNFLLMNRAADSDRMKEQFVDLKVKQATQRGDARSVIDRQDAEKARQARVAQMGTAERLAQVPKSVVGGFAEGVGTSLKGIAALSRKVNLGDEYKGKETKDLATYQLGEAITQSAKQILGSNPDLEQEFFVGKAPATVGQVAQFMLGGWATKSPKLAVVILGSGMTAGDAYDEVRARGGTDDEAVNAALLAGGLLGPTELIGMRGAMKAISGTAREATFKAAMKTALREGRRDAVENALQEMGQEFGQGVITKSPRTPGQLLEAGTLGAIGGTATVPLTFAGSMPAASRSRVAQDGRVMRLTIGPTGKVTAAEERTTTPGNINADDYKMTAIAVGVETKAPPAPPEVPLPAPVDTRRPEDFLPSFFPRTKAPEPSATAKMSTTVDNEGQARALPKTLAAAGLEKGENLTYTPATLAEGATAGRLMVQEKGIDGAIEHVLRGDAGIEWAPTGYAVLSELRAEEARRLESDPEGAAAASSKRRRFAGEFAERATELGQSIAGVRAIEEFAPDRATFVANRISLKRRGKPLTEGEDVRILRISEDLQKANERNQYLEKTLDQIKTRIEEKGKSKRRAERLDYRARLEADAATIKQTLKPRVGKFDFGNLARPAEKGELRLGHEALPGDAELLAKYGAARLSKLDTVDALNAEMLAEFGKEIAPYLPKIRQRAYRIRQEARLDEIENTQTETARRRTILQELQKEISETQRAVDDAAKAQVRARKGELSQAGQEQRIQAQSEASVAKAAEREWSAEEAAQERARLKELRREYREASKAQSQGYRQTIAAQREAARKAGLWDTPIRDAANAARQRLVNADPKSPDTLNALVAVAAEKLLPTKIGGIGRMGVVRPTQLYIQLQTEFPKLVTRKNQGEIYKRAYQRVEDMTSAAREAATLRSASQESRRMWEKLGLDTDTQAILIQRATARREQLEARREMAAEFERVSRTKLGKVLFEVQSIPRALQSSIDAPIGRQGMFYLITHPIETARFTVPATLKGYASLKRGVYAQRVAELEAHPYYDLARRAGVDLTQATGTGDPRTSAEESFQSTLAERLPHVRLSQQGFTLGMNTQRVYAFERYARLGESQGYAWETRPEFFQQAAALINDATGRGNMRDSIKRMSALTNAVFYSTRLNISRLQLLNDFLNPVKIKNYDPVMRRLVAGELIRLAVGMGVIYGTAKMLGLGVTMDPDDPDFGKVVVGKTHYDVTGGEAATVRFLFRELRGVYALATGEKLSYAQDPFTVASRFVRQKLAPWPSAAIDFMYGKNVVGQPANLKVELSKPAQTVNENIALRMITPFVVGDFADAAALDGWLGVGKNVPALAGVGVTHYDKTQKIPKKERKN